MNIPSLRRCFQVNGPAPHVWLTLVGLLWFLGFILPSFIRPNDLIVADFIEHRMYVPIVGMFIVLLKHDFWEKIRLSRKSLVAICGVIVLVFGVKNVTYQQNFKNRLSFWQNAAQNSPHSPLARRNLGVMYYFDQRYTEALEQYNLSAALNPHEPMVHNNIGVLLMQQGKLDAAAKEFLEELKLNPQYDNAMFNLGLVYYQMNNKDGAAELWEETARINPGYLDAYRNLIIYYQKKENADRAQYYSDILQQAIQSSP